MVKIIIGNVYSKIAGQLPEQVHEEIHEVLSYFVKGAEYSPKYMKGSWDGRMRFYSRARGQSFYTGLLNVVVNILIKNEIPHSKMDARKRPDSNLKYLTFSGGDGYQERDYQSATIDLAYRKTRGILKMATGAGKTTVVTKLIGEIKTAPFMFYVLNKDLLDQAYKTMVRYLNVPIGRIGGGFCDIQDINVCTIQTAIRALNLDNKNFDIDEYRFDEDDAHYWKDKDIEGYDRLSAIRQVIRASQGLYFDEMHHASASTSKAVLEASINAYWRYGGSATPYREDNADILLQALFGRKIVDINASYLIERGWLLKPYIFFCPVQHEVAHHSYQKIYSECVNNCEHFNMSVASTANKMAENGLLTLILVQKYKQGDLLKKYLSDLGKDVQFITGKMALKAREKHIDDLRNRKSNILIATTLADEGLDVPALDGVLQAGGGASATRVNQRVGRTLRPDYDSKDRRSRSVVVIYDHKVKYLHDHALKAKRILKEEPEFEIIKSKGLSAIDDEIFDKMNLQSGPNLFNL